MAYFNEREDLSMSAFLGSVHHWLYKKIQIQESMTQAILSICTKQDRSSLEDMLFTQCGAIPTQPLEDVIDTRNIHGWLQAQIGIAEKRFATLVTTIQKNKQIPFKTLLQCMQQQGAKAPFTNVVDAPSIYHALQDMLLDGMPCDQVNAIVQQDAHCIVWEQRIDVHAPFWEAVGGCCSDYDQLRNAFVSGAMSSLPFCFHQENKQFFIQEVNHECH